MEELDHSKTEDATPYKLDKARRKGMVARGQDLGVFVSVVSIAGYLWVFGDTFSLRIAHATQRALSGATQLGDNSQALPIWAVRLLVDGASALAPFAAIVFAAALASSLVQTGFIFAPGAMKPDFSKLNPANGLKRVFSAQTIIDTIKAIVKLVVYGMIAWLVVRQATKSVIHLGADLNGILVAMKRTGIELLTWFALAAIVFAAIDQLIVRRQFGKKMRMSRRELRDEMRNREGDPRIRQRRKQLHGELRKRIRSMRGVRGADFMVTNPTHVAVALRYDAVTMSAPKLVSRGAGDFAQRLKRLAFIYGVPIFEERALARELYARGHLDEEIPETAFTKAASIYQILRDRAAGAVAA